MTVRYSKEKVNHCFKGVLVQVLDGSAVLKLRQWKNERL